MGTGCLYIVATPIGNLADITQRAVDTLKNVDIVAAEDTRHSRKLLTSIGINAKLIALHDHNERTKSQSLVHDLQSGKNIALISDAGTPMISDPGYHLVRAAQDVGIQVSPIPGPSAVISALSVSGLSANRFYFYGFLPEKNNARKTLLQSLSQTSETLVFYESGKRVVASLEAMYEAFGAEREIVIARELTKLHESIARTSLENIKTMIQGGELEQRGEFVLLVEGDRNDAAKSNQVLMQQLIHELKNELPTGKAASIISKITHVPRKQVYQVLLADK